jgi:hypothetical protein
MRGIWLLVGLLAALPVSAQDLYVRPAEGTYGTSDGTSYANAFDGFADVAWGASANQVGDGDTLYVCGEFDLDSIDGGSFPMMQVDSSGSSDVSRVTVNGDCSAQGERAQAVLDGEGVRERGIDSGGSGQAYVTLKNIRIRNFISKGVFSQGTNTVLRAWRLENIDVEEIRGAAADGIDLRGSGHYVDANTSVTNVGDDAWYVEGDNFTMLGALCQYPSLDSVTGDCLQMDKEADNFLVDGFRCYQSVDAKQCVFVSTTSFTGSGIIRDSRCYGPSATATLHTCFFVQNLSGTLTAYRNYGENSRYLLYAGGTATTMIAYSNIGRAFSSFGIQCGTNSTSCSIIGNSISDAPVCFSTESASGTSSILNNMGIDCATSGIRKNAGDAETNNAIYASGAVVQNETTTTTPSTTDILTDPKLVGGAAPADADGFRLKFNSPLITKGAYLGGTYRDYRNSLRQIPPSIGAYEDLEEYEIFGGRNPARGRQ